MVRAPEEGGRGDAKRHQRHRLLSRKARGEKGAKKTIGRGKGNPLSPLSSARPRGLLLSSFPPRDSRAERERERRRPSRSRLAERRPSSVLRTPRQKRHRHARARARPLSFRTYLLSSSDWDWRRRLLLFCLSSTLFLSRYSRMIRVWGIRLTHSSSLKELPFRRIEKWLLRTRGLRSNP